MARLMCPVCKTRPSLITGNLSTSWDTCKICTGIAVQQLVSRTSDTLSHEVWELLETCKSARADVNRLKACTCTKGKGITRKDRRLCNSCQALAKFRTLRKGLEKLKNQFKP